MTLRYRFLNHSNEWVVVGPAGELQLGPVLVTKMDGEPKPETVIRLSKVYSVDGDNFRFGYIRQLPRGGKKRKSGAPLPAAPVEFEQAEPTLIDSGAHADAILDMADKNQALMTEIASTRAQLIRLLNYVMNMREDYPGFAWPDLPDTYGDSVWRPVQ